MDTYEKKYKNALTIAQSRFKIEKDESVLTCLGMMFPELRESEDERIISSIIAVLENDKKHYLNEIAWLEKHKEEKPIEDVVKDITKDKESATKFLKSAGIMDDNGELAEMYRSEQKLVDYDHEMWKNCEANFEGRKKEVIDHPEKYGLQKNQMSAEWSEEDKEKIDHLSFLLTLAEANEFITASKRTELGNFLMKILRLQPKQEWSEKDEMMRVRTINRLETLNFHGISGKEIRESIDWLKSIHSQSQGVYKTAIESILKMCESYEKKGIFTDERAIDFLDNVRVKCNDAIECTPILDESSWKPSKELMKALGASIVFHKDDPFVEKLWELYNQLQKL